MISEAAFCIALEKKNLKSKGGILTPSAAFGDTLIKRLREADVFIDVVDDFQKKIN